jgi:zinc protease
MRAFPRALAVGLLTFGFLWAPMLTAPAWAQVFNPETFTLKNGMQVVVVSNHRVPIVTHMVWYKVGSADEVPGKTGLAHMVEHMMFKGTKTIPAGQFSHLVAINGGRENAFTTEDYTAFYQNVAVDKLELVMKLEADRMANLALKDADFQPEHQVVIEERRQRIDNEPASLLEERVEAALYLAYPYHHPVIGWRPDMEKYVLKDVVDFHQRWYAPNNAILVVSGDVTAAQVRPLAEKYYGIIPPRPVPPRDRADEPPPAAPRTVELRDPEVHQPAWSRQYLAPSYHYGDTKYAYALQVLSEILGGGETSRLYKDLVVDQRLAASASAGYDPDSVGPSAFSFSCSPRPGVPLDKLQAAMVGEIQSVANDGVKAEEVERAKGRLKASIAYAKDSYQTGARVLGAALATGTSVEDEEGWPQRIAAVTPEQVRDAAKAVLRDERAVTGTLLPATEAEATTESVAKQPPSQLPAGVSGREVR